VWVPPAAPAFPSASTQLAVLASLAAAGERPERSKAGEQIVSESGRPPPIQPTGVFDGLQPGAILIGVVVDNLATFVASALLVSLFATELAREHGGELPEEALEPLLASPEFLLASLIVGLLCTVFGAYVGARRAACFFIRHGAWIAVGSAISALVLYASAGQQGPRPPLWFDMVGFALMIPAGALGGLLANYHLRGAGTDTGMTPGRSQ
jgi:hypothetical protein